MYYTEKQNILGLLLLVDLEKAFDSVSWSFFHFTLKFLGFSPSILCWVRTINQNIKAAKVAFYLNSLTLKRDVDKVIPLQLIFLSLVHKYFLFWWKNNKATDGIKIERANYKIT